MLRTGFFNSTQSWGGGEKWHLDMATALANEGLPVMLFAQKDGSLYQRARSAKLPIAKVNISNWSFLRLTKILQLKKLFQQQQLDAIILNLPADLKTAGIAAKWAGVKRIIYRRGSAIPIKANVLNKFLFRHIVTDILANSRATKKTINAKAALFPLQKIRVIPNGLHNDAFSLPAKEVHSPIRIGHLGRFVYQKNQAFLIEVAKELKCKDIDVEWHLGGNGPMWAQIKAAAEEAELEHIQFPGFIDNSKQFFQAMDIVVLPSRWEGFGYVIAEAMAVGKPVVAFDISSNPELITHEVNGKLVPAEDIGAFSEALLQLIKNPQRILEMGAHGYKEMQKEFTFTKAVTNLKDFLGYAQRH